MHRLRGKLTYANVISTVCLFLLLGGGAAYAASHQLPKNSVGPKQLKKGAVTPAKLTAATRVALTGAAGPAGPKGAPGAPGAAGATNVVIRVGATEKETSEARCQGNEVAVGGGGYALKDGTFLWASEPVAANRGTGLNHGPAEGEKPIAWRVSGEAAPEKEEAETLQANAAAEVQAYVVCASP